MKATFKATIFNPRYTLFEGEVKSVFLPGAEGEFEVLAFHKSIISLLRQGEIIIDNERSIVISKGIVRMYKDELVALVE